jgi:hypothetical protein
MLTKVDDNLTLEKLTYLNTVTYEFFKPGTQFAKVLSAMQIQNALTEQNDRKETGGFLCLT